MRYIKYLFLVVLGLFSVSCSDDPLKNDTTTPGYISLDLSFLAPDMTEVLTKDADPDGKGVNKMNIFCFDAYGMFLDYLGNVTITPNSAQGENPYSVNGKINTVEIPENTRRIHFVANQNTTTFNESAVKGLSEYEVMAKLEGSSGMIIYWGYFAVNASEVTSAQEFENRLLEAHGEGKTPVKLLRNQARFTVPDVSNKFDVTGFTVVNTSAFGTVAPHHPQKGFNFTVEGDKPDWLESDFLTLPENRTRRSNPLDVDIAEDTFVFETDNSSAHPVSIIIKGKNWNSSTGSYGDELYYRVILMDENSNYIPVRRNFHYRVNITGELSYGQTSFEAALTAPASNNAWLSIADEIKEVSNSQYTLEVLETDIQLLAVKSDDKWKLSKPVKNAKFDLIEPVAGIASSHHEVDLGYYLTKKGGNVGMEDIPEVVWAEGQEISTMAPINDFMLDGGIAEPGKSYNEVSVILDNLSGLDSKESIQGTVVITKGLLQRKIKITILKALNFTPVWVSTQVNANAGENLTLLFTIPDECPDELLPFNVYISANHVDIRGTSTVHYPIITYETNPDEYGADTYANDDDETDKKAIGYKYVYTVTKKGDQRIYFHNLLHRDNNNSTERITIESPFFNTVKKTIVFNNSSEYRIEMPGLMVVDTDEHGEHIDINKYMDELIKYILVPQKLNAPVALDLAFVHVNNNGTTTDMSNTGTHKLGTNDEFLFYSENLMHAHGHYNGDSNESGENCHCQFIDINTALWGSGGKVHAVRFRDGDNVPNATSKTYGTTQRDVYTLNMKTSKAKSAEVVRISSNQTGSPVAFGSGNYSGNTYRSIIFELANYNPFKFNAQLGWAGTNITTSEEGVVGELEIPYNEESVDLYFDITSFTGSDKNEVDPFGTEFYVYIVAPMLKLPAESDKLYTIKDGVFCYVVDASRENEKNSFFKVLEENERKKITLQKKSVVGDGEILLTTNPVTAGVSGTDTKGKNHDQQIVVFSDKTFKVHSKRITGNIQTKDGETLSNMKDGAFVTFTLTSNDSRIGSMRIYDPKSVGDKSTYELTLRPEYTFTKTDEIRVAHTHTSGNVTETFICSTETRKGSNSEYKFTLSDLFINPDIVLVKQ